MRKSVSLARYIGVGNLALMLSPLLILAGWNILSFDGIMRQSFAAVNALSAAAISSRFDEFFARPKDVLARVLTIVEHPSLYAKNRLGDYLEETLANYPFVDRIQVMGADDRVIACAPRTPSLIGISRAGERVYEEVKRSEEIRWSPSYISTEHNEPAITFGIHAGGYTVLCDLNLSWIGSFAARLTSISSQAVEVRVTDENGIFLANPEKGKVRQRERQKDFALVRLHGRTRDIFVLREDRTTWLASVARVSGPAWYVLVLYPESNFFASLRRLYIEVAVLSIAAGLLGFFIWRLRFRRIGRALEGISLEAERISRGSYRELEEFGEGFREFERVGRSLDSMIAGIRSRESVLRDRERGFREILEKIGLAAIGVDQDGRIVFVNTFLLEVSGYAAAEIIGKTLRIFLPDDESLATCPFTRMLRGDRLSPSVQCLWRMKSGEERLMEWNLAVNLDAAGALAGVTGIGVDVTEKTRQRAALEASLQEKEILLKEIHHRVKNNLQIVTSLLSLQDEERADEKLSGYLAEARSRINSIALVHESLYGSENLGDLDFGQYADDLARELLGDEFPVPVDLRVRSSPLMLSLIEAIPCGLILNEALTNIRKYAFPPGWEGERIVELEVAEGEDGKARIRLRDNGVGLPPLFDASTADSLGLTIMRLLAAQIGGSIELRSEAGTLVELEFPKPQRRPGF
ncbi:MAG TPA: histidine kinase dimerization/phosphoacceptor domain -containing protein [Rectinemataceae bacterium]|nr:histidine kinase dimerization/phosphoacceptor domain -containing protein [Rectinemataceae bacterium]